MSHTLIFQQASKRSLLLNCCIFKNLRCASSKAKSRLKYFTNNDVPPHRVGVIKSWDSKHTGGIEGSLWAHERFIDDVMLRKFIQEQQTEQEDDDFQERSRSSRLRPREELNRSRKDLLLHILSSPGDENSLEDEAEKESAASSSSDPNDYCWIWDEKNKSHDVVVCNGGREAYFHPDYSCGTAAVRGTYPLTDGWEHYWEIKMSSAVYGTDMMIGVGTRDVDLNKYKSQFCSMLGRDAESWGLSYFGTFQNGGKTKEFTEKFERGTIIGVHLDMWKGTLSFFRNGTLIGVAANDLQGKILYPIVASTAARTRMKLECSHSAVFSLQYLCVKEISKNIAHTPEAVETLPLSKGMKMFLHRHLRWLSNVNNSPSTPGPKRKKQKISSFERGKVNP